MIFLFIGLNILSIIIISGVIYFITIRNKNGYLINENNTDRFDKLNENVSRDYITIALGTGSIAAFFVSSILIFLYFTNNDLLGFIK